MVEYCPDFVHSAIILAFSHRAVPTVLAGMVVPGGNRPLELQVELVDPNDNRALVFLGNSRPPVRQAVVWPRE